MKYLAGIAIQFSIFIVYSINMLDLLFLLDKRQPSYTFIDYSCFAVYDMCFDDL